ncbi:hypothetical protein BKP35_12490 [Anaerobacillus arseniciselenatis]|uniref:Uncharacterized protein n=1 Tax=Anaerobacillus arseniciselenatis TaxID=85682 RepID=A0A1S2LFR1_9BACI|nr:hypothetical protein [Anaerobacillus arseniciselenatis]OIJ10903.1 hypothetical protein BKP35_12490 [Anaerobacillus arseniciselenatis]
MKKHWDEHSYSKLNKVSWSEDRKRNLHQKLMNDIDQLERRKKFKHAFVYVASLALFFAVIFVGYNFSLFEQQQTPAVIEEEEIDLVEEPELLEEQELIEEPDVVTEDEERLFYYGTINASEDYFTIAMTDSNVMYYIPVSSRMTIDILKHVNFEYTSNSNLNIKYGLRFARSDIPLQSYEIEDEHLHLYFKKDDLMNIRGSTGVGMGLFSINTFATNFSDKVTHYTAYGDGEPFSHEGEDFDIIDVPLDRNSALLADRSAVYLPISTEKGIFLRQYFPPTYSIEDIFADFFSLHTQAITEVEIDLSKFSFDTIEERDGKIVIHLKGDINKAYEKNNIDKESLKSLIVHGVGANLREQFDHEQARIYLNEEQLFEGSLSHIRINSLDELAERQVEATSQR